jgi:hypothetical protein
VVLAIVAVIAPVALLAGGGGSDAPTVGDPAPEFMLASAEGEQRALGELLADREALVLVFYRGVF